MKVCAGHFLPVRRYARVRIIVKRANEVYPYAKIVGGAMHFKHLLEQQSTSPVAYLHQNKSKGMSMRNFYIILIATALFSSCDKIWRESDSEITFTVGFANESEVRQAANFNLAFNEGDDIGIFVYSRKSSDNASPDSNTLRAENVKITYTNGMWQTEEVIYHAGGGDVLDIYAYYPYQHGAQVQAIAYDASLEMEDLLIASCLGVDSSTRGAPVPLLFSHLLAMTRVVVEGKGDLPNFDSSFRIYFHGAVGGNYNLATRNITNPYTGVVRMTLISETSERQRTYQALIPAQEITSGVMFSYIQTGMGKEFSLVSEVSETQTLSAGKASLFHVELETQVRKNIQYDLYEKYPKFGRPIGVVVEVSMNGYSGKLVSIYTLPETPWSIVDMETGATDTHDGISNKMRVQSIDNWSETFPAFRACVGLGESWYLPTSEEVYDNLYLHITNLNEVLKGIEGADTINYEHVYHTSTEVSSSHTLRIDLGAGAAGEILPVPKSTPAYVRAFYEF